MYRDLIWLDISMREHPVQALDELLCLIPTDPAVVHCHLRIADISISESQLGRMTTKGKSTGSQEVRQSSSALAQLRNIKACIFTRIFIGSQFFLLANFHFYSS